MEGLGEEIERVTKERKLDLESLQVLHTLGLTPKSLFQKMKAQIFCIRNWVLFISFVVWPALTYFYNAENDYSVPRKTLVKWLLKLPDIWLSKVLKIFPRYSKYSYTSWKILNLTLWHLTDSWISWLAWLTLK